MNGINRIKGRVTVYRDGNGDRRLGVGVGAKRERARLSSEVES